MTERHQRLRASALGFSVAPATLCDAAPSLPDTAGARADRSTWHIFSDDVSAALIASAVGQRVTCAHVASYSQLLAAVERTFGAVVLVDATRLPPCAEELQQIVRRTWSALAFMTTYSSTSARAVLTHMALAPRTIVPITGQSQPDLAPSLASLYRRPLALAYLQVIAPRLSTAHDALVAAILPAVHARSSIDSVKLLASACGATPRTVERWFNSIDISAQHFVRALRLLRVREALDQRLAPSVAAQRGGYARAATMWRAVRGDLALDPRAFRLIPPEALVQRLAATPKPRPCASRETHTYVA